MNLRFIKTTKVKTTLLIKVRLKLNKPLSKSLKKTNTQKMPVKNVVIIPGV